MTTYSAWLGRVTKENVPTSDPDGAKSGIAMLLATWRIARRIAGEKLDAGALRSELVLEPVPLFLGEGETPANGRGETVTF